MNNMTTEQAIYQLTDLIRDRESFFHRGDFDEVFLQDIEACKAGIQALEKQLPKEKTGHWNTEIGYDIERTVMCDQCRRMAYEPSCYCPNCGAKMAKTALKPIT